jgi:uroporphyrinogen decarboxylase
MSRQNKSLREMFLNSIKRTDARYVPFHFNLCPAQKEKFRNELGIDDISKYFELPCRMVFPVIRISENEKRERFFNYHEDMDGAINEWGVIFQKGSTEHFTKMVHPMRCFSSINEFESYPYPNAEKDYNWDVFNTNVESIKMGGNVAVAHLGTTIFEIAWYLRGMDNLLVDMIMNEQMAIYHLDRITDIRCYCAGVAAKSGVDMIWLGDDVSTQLDMMMAPETWRKYLKPRLKKVIDSAKEVKEDVLIVYHGDGNLQKIIPELINVGVDILNPVQPECMDPIEIKKKYGDRLSFWGTLGTQTTLPFGTPEEVKSWCWKMIREVGYNGGLCLAPTHLVEPEVPWENICAFIETVQEYNKGCAKNHTMNT